MYRHIQADKIVANCHKLPQKEFFKELLTVADISESLHAIWPMVQSINNTAKLICTVSPVRHLKDGFIENMRSKAHLLTAIHELSETNNNCFYFPAYELMMDEFRDYRFYRRT